MTRFTGASALRVGLLAGLLAAGCGVGNDGGFQGTNTLGRICSASLTITGSFEQGMAKPADVNGCWPVGTWTFSAAIASNDCDTAPTFLPQYQFKVDQTLDADGNPEQSFTYLTDPNSHFRVKVTSGGAGQCEGELDLYSTDGTEVWILHPELYDDLSVLGDGEYSLYDSDQWIGE